MYIITRFIIFGVTMIGSYYAYNNKSAVEYPVPNKFFHNGAVVTAAEECSRVGL